MNKQAMLAIKLALRSVNTFPGGSLMGIASDTSMLMDEQQSHKPARPLCE